MKLTKMRTTLTNRTAWFILLMGGLGLLLAGRLFWLQVITQNSLESKNLDQVQRERKLQSPRGTIYDRHGSPMAMSVVTKSLYADPQMLKDRSPEEVADLIGPYVDLPKEKIVEKLNEDTSFVWIQRMMDADKSRALQKVLDENSLDGLKYVEESKRYYPNGNLLAHVLGFVGTDDKGLDGIEMVYDDRLKGGEQRELVMTDPAGNAIFGSVMQQYLPEEGKSVTLTVDSTVQFIAERALDNVMATVKPTRASVIIMDPKTGEILAMANRPTYDPNQYYKSSEAAFKNTAVTDLYEPGSTFKPIIASIALATGKWTLNTTYNDTGSIVVNGRTIRNWDGEGHGIVRMVDIIKMSLNTGMVRMGLDTGKDILSDYVRRYGFGKATGIELPGEGDGILYDPADMIPGDTASMSFGQGIAVTPLQMVQAMGAIANHGTMMKPHIVQSLNNPDGSVDQSMEDSQAGEPIPQETADTIKDIMEQEVSTGGGSHAMVEGYKFAGKTGTAEKLNTEAGGYLPGQYIASFVGFGPVEDPRFVILVTINTPTAGSIYGGQIAAPVFRDIASQLVRYFQLSPSVRDKSQAKAVKQQSLPEPSYQNGSLVLPNFDGFSLGQVRDWLNKTKLNFKPIGTGTAVNQDPGPGTTVDEGDTITVNFTH